MSKEGNPAHIFPVRPGYRTTELSVPSPLLYPILTPKNRKIGVNILDSSLNICKKPKALHVEFGNKVHWDTREHEGDLHFGLVPIWQAAGKY